MTRPSNPDCLHKEKCANIHERIKSYEFMFEIERSNVGILLKPFMRKALTIKNNYSNENENEIGNISDAKFGKIWKLHRLDPQKLMSNESCN